MIKAAIFEGDVFGEFKAGVTLIEQLHRGVCLSIRYWEILREKFSLCVCESFQNL